MIRKLGIFTALLSTAMLSFSAAAQPVTGQPYPWQLGLQAAADERMRDIIGLHNFVLYIITAICLFVLALLVYIMLRFNAKLTSMSAEQFVRDVLIDRLHAREVWIGPDFRFGKGRAGDLTLLRDLARALAPAPAEAPRLPPR